MIISVRMIEVLPSTITRVVSSRSPAVALKRSALAPNSRLNAGVIVLACSAKAVSVPCCASCICGITPLSSSACHFVSTALATSGSIGPGDNVFISWSFLLIFSRDCCAGAKSGVPPLILTSMARLKRVTKRKY